MPDQPSAPDGEMPPLWVIDDGRGMDAGGFRQLWRIADSNKENSPEYKGRSPIGQFGIGKLAAYVIAWNLTHVSRVDGKLLLTAMNFEEVGGSQADGADPVQVDLREIPEDEAKRLLSDIESRDSSAWRILFGEDGRAETWTAVALSNFRDMYKKLRTGILRRVLSAALPLRADFAIRLNGEEIKSSKLGLVPIHTVSVDETVPGIGQVKGEANIYENPLNTGKSERIERSNGFFVRVRGRVINLEDDSFGMEPFNYAAWSRFEMEVAADGLRGHLLSNREGVRESDEVHGFREILRKSFNECRTAYDNRVKPNIETVDIVQILNSNEVHPTRLVEPVLLGVSNAVKSGGESFYVNAPQDVTEVNRSDWLASYQSEVSDGTGLFSETVFDEHGPKAPSIRYYPAAKKLTINSDHPFVDKIINVSRKRDIAKLFAFAEVLIEGQLLEHGVEWASLSKFLEDRDYALRLIAGRMSPPTALTVLRMLDLAANSANDLEIATGSVFQTLGFKYQRAGGNAPGPDGELYAQLGRHKDRLADYKVVYDAKSSQSSAPSAPADKIDFANLARFIEQSRADYGFFIAPRYQGEDDETRAVNFKLKQTGDSRLTLLKISHLRRLVTLHYEHGVTLSDVRRLFSKAGSVPEVERWLDDFEKDTVEKGEIPIQVLLEGLEREKEDVNAAPNVATVRKSQMAELGKFTPEHLAARLSAVENIIGSRWIEVDYESREVQMHGNVSQILESLDHNIRKLDLSIG